MVRGLHAYYGQRRALKGIDLEFAANQVTAIIEPPGCGKSTMVRRINRMHEETLCARVEGAVWLDGLDVYDPRIDVIAVRRLIGMVFQKPNPFPTMPIFEKVAAGLNLTGTRGADLAIGYSARCTPWGCGTRSRIGLARPVSVYRVVSSSVCASQERSRRSLR
jgi:phosphate transport system ATP-binding protein